MVTVKIHAIATLWPDMTPDEWEEFRADVATHGLVNPIVTWRGAVVDGKHRSRACDETGVPPRYDALDDTWDEWRVVLHCASLHRRRNLTPAQRAMVGASITERFAPAAAVQKAKGRPKQGAHILPSAEGKMSRGVRTSAGQAAAASGSSTASVERALYVTRSAPEVAALVRDGTVSLKVGERLAKISDPAKRAAATVQLTTASRTEADGDSWGTPQEWIDVARAVMGGIDLDPASNAEAQTRVCADVYYTAADDGLSHPWPGRVWLNPPYSQPLVSQFTEHLLGELSAKRCKQAMVLVNNATDTRFAQALLGSCSAVLFPAGRVSFLVPGSGEAMTGTRQGQMLVYFGPNVKRFASACGALGWVGVSS